MIKFNCNNLKTLKKHLEDLLVKSNVEVAINNVHIGKVTSFEVDESEVEEKCYEFSAYNGFVNIGHVFFNNQNEISVNYIEGHNSIIGLISINFETTSNQ